VPDFAIATAGWKDRVVVAIYRCDQPKPERPMTSFNDREKSFEKKFEKDQELQFKVNARRNKLLGLWAAEQMGKNGADAEAYAKEVVMADFEKPGDSDVMAKLVKDLAAAGKPMEEHTIRKHSERLLDDAKNQVMTEVKA
jgi:hypothetical protein